LLVEQKIICLISNGNIWIKNQILCLGKYTWEDGNVFCTYHFVEIVIFLAVTQKFQRKSSALNTDSHFCNYPLLRLESCVFHEHVIVLLLRIAFLALIITAPETEQSNNF
jgi:hypothetical protein